MAVRKFIFGLLLKKLKDRLRRPLADRKGRQAGSMPPVAKRIGRGQRD
jgi:hypothetical protein